MNIEQANQKVKVASMAQAAGTRALNDSTE
jgi:hypothetical protein